MSMIPAQVIVWLSVRENPAQMKSMITKSSIVFLTSGLLLVSFGHMQERYMSKLAEKYLAGLSDDQLRNLKN